MTKERILTRSFCFSFLSLLCCGSVMYMLMTTVTEYAAGYGASPTVAGLVSGAYIAAGLVTRLWSGRALSRIPWRALCVAAPLLHLLACCCYFLVNSLPALLLVRVLHGLAFGATANTIITVGMSVLPKSRYGEANGYLMLAPTLAVALGPYVGGFAYDRFGPAGCFTAACVLCALALLFLLLVDFRGVEAQAKAEQQGTGDSPRGLNRFLETSCIPISLCVFTVAFGYVAVMSFHRLYAAELGLSREFSWLTLIYAAVLLCVRPAAGRVQDRLGDNPVCYPGIFAQTAGLVCVALRPGVPAVLICAVGCAMGYGVLNSACNAIACRSVPLRRKSFAVSTFWICCDVGMGLGPVALGAVRSAFDSYAAMYLAAAAVTLLTWPLYYFAWGRKQGRRRRAKNGMDFPGAGV